jgi:two-component system, NarL family, response regulator
MSRPASRIRVLCADDHRIVREGLALIINQHPDLAVVGLAASGKEAVALFTQLQPDVTIMDLQMEGGAGVESIEAIRRGDPDAKVIVLTMYVGDEDIHRAVSAGAAAYLFKNTISDDLVRVIRDVHRGERPAMSPDLKARLDERAGRPRITLREVQVLEMISHGLRDKEIASAMNISERTVHVHVQNILLKLGAKDRTAAVRTAVKRGIIRMM